jgi:hypothetical protein
MLDVLYSHVSRFIGCGARRVATAHVLVCAGLAPLPVLAQEYCVSCTGPVGVYRCVIDGARPGAVPSLQILCVERMAKAGGHDACAVKRGVTVFDCDAPVKRVTIGGADVASPAGVPTAAAVATPDGQVAPDTQAVAQSAQMPASTDEPKTMLELAKRANAAAAREAKLAGQELKETTEKTGNALGTAWRCMASFFTQCTAK